MFEFKKGEFKEEFDTIKINDKELKIPLNITLKSLEQIKSLRDRFLKIASEDFVAKDFTDSVNDLLTMLSEIFGKEVMTEFYNYYDLATNEKGAVLISSTNDFHKLTEFLKNLIKYLNDDYFPKVHGSFKVEQDKVTS